ncbi:hypothetical protein, partial [Streptomyces fradiae]|uniref:hypothetical protein n=1 Tax=Streptomyces fradiae TaxID=1906 RepID=UPI001CA4AD86
MVSARHDAPSQANRGRSRLTGIAPVDDWSGRLLVMPPARALAGRGRRRLTGEPAKVRPTVAVLRAVPEPEPLGVVHGAGTPGGAGHSP